MVEVDALERGRESIGVALPPHFPVGDHVDAGPLHVLDGEPCRVVLGLLEERLRYLPELTRSHARRQPLSEQLSVDQPVGLRIAPDDRRDRSFMNQARSSLHGDALSHLRGYTVEPPALCTEEPLPVPGTSPKRRAQPSATARR